MKKIFVFLLCVVLFSALPVIVVAAEEKEPDSLQKKIEAINKTNAASYAMDFINTICNDLTLQSGNVSVFYSENDKVSGYCIDIMDGDIPNGYVIIKFSNNKPVVSEFALETGVKSPYLMLIEKNNITKENSKFYSIGSNDYQIYDLQKI